MEFIFPLFKFSKKNHIENFLSKGQIRIGSLFEYRDHEKYKGKILDTDEGRKQISVYFENVTFKDEDGKKLSSLGFEVGKGANVKLSNTTFSFKLDSPNCYIYSTSAVFSTETLIQAVSDGYDSCALIVNPDDFFSDINNMFKKGKALGYFPCLYGDRDIILNWDTDKDYIKILEIVPASIIKPVSLQVQKEVRGIWLPYAKSIEPEIIEIGSLTGYIKEVVIDDINIEVIKNRFPGYKVGVRIIRNGDKGDSLFSIEFPNEIFTPVVYHDEKKQYLGFKSQSNTQEYRKPYINNADIGIAFTDIGNIFCLNAINEIIRLEYFTMKT